MPHQIPLHPRHEPSPRRTSVKVPRISFALPAPMFLAQTHPPILFDLLGSRNRRQGHHYTDASSLSVTSLCMSVLVNAVYFHDDLTPNHLVPDRLIDE